MAITHNTQLSFIEINSEPNVMKRILPLLLVLPLGAYAFACKSTNNNDGTDTAGETPAGTNPGDPGAPGTNPGDPNQPGGPTGPATPDELKTNPIEGIDPAKAVLEAGAFTDGPVWHAGVGALYFTTPLGEGGLYRMKPDGSVIKLRDGNKIAGTTPIGTTINGAGDLITVDAKRVTRAAVAGDAGGAEVVVATGYTPGATADAGAGANGQFDTLNDVVSRKDGTLYVTDPGYFATPISNRIYRIDPSGKVQVVEAFDDVPRPNGIAISPDEKNLYVGFSAPVQGTLPFIRKYTVNADGTLGEWTKFIDVGPADSSPDGLAIDRAGNLYVATKAGIEVYKADGTKWGVVAVPEKPTGMTFGGTDMKTLYITSEGVKIWQINTKVAGLSQ